MAKKVKTPKWVLSFVEATREALRLVVIAAVPLLIDGLQNGAVDWRGVMLVSCIVILRFAEKLAYENGKDGNLNPVSKVLTFSN